MKPYASLFALALPLVLISSSAAFAQMEPSMEQSQKYLQKQSCPNGQKSTGGKNGKCVATKTTDPTLQAKSDGTYHASAHGQLATGITPSGKIADSQLAKIHWGTSQNFVDKNTPAGGTGDSSTAGNQMRGRHDYNPPGITDNTSGR